MGLCSSCGQSKDRFKDKSSKICGQIHSAVVAAPLHGPHEPATTSNCLLNGNCFENFDANRKSNNNSAMAASFSNMNITNPIRGLVSKRRNRYKEDGFNLDLTYITPNIIAMGYPASNIESVYRNNIDDVVKMLEKKHTNHYFIYNLCSERINQSYDKSKFHNRVKNFPFDDHNPPKMELIQPFCQTVHEWLALNPANVAAVHCKAGKGRTGTMICCYLLHSGMYRTADEALGHYGGKRTQDRKGVTIPSQVRYVRYYERLLRDGLIYAPVPLYIRWIRLKPAPTLPGGQGFVCFAISAQTLDASGGGDAQQKCTTLYKSGVYEVKRGLDHLTIELDVCLILSGDIKVEFYNRSKIGRKERQLQFWFNTFFVRHECERSGEEEDDDGVRNGFSTTIEDCNNGGGVCDLNYVVRLRKDELDIVSKKDKQNKVFSADFELTLALGKVPKSSESHWPNFSREIPHHAQDTPSESSEADSSDGESAEESWESVLDGGGDEPIADPRGVGYRILSECELASQLTASSNGTNEQQPLTA